MKIIDKLIEMGYSSEYAKKIITAGQVKANQVEVFNISEEIKNDAEITIKENKKYVSRGALKLVGAIEKFDIDFKDKVVLDIGSSTGGFTQVALENGAKHVYALDVGTNQLDFSLRRLDKVTAIEKTNLKRITEDMFEEKIDIALTDVSFISVRHVFDVLSRFSYDVELMALIKPQFEAYRDQVEKGGYVNKESHNEIINRVFEHAKKYNYINKNIEESPILGGKSKNIEYISLFRRDKNEK